MARSAAQEDLNRAHVKGGAGMIVSGAAWLAAGAAFLVSGPRTAFFTLFVCGLAITPVAQLATRFVFKAPPSGVGKRREAIAVATVPVLLAGFYLGYLRLPAEPLAAIPIVAIAVALRYLAFPLMYGGTVFGALGAVFIAAGAAGLAAPGPVALPATLGLALTELGAGLWLARQWQAERATG